MNLIEKILETHILSGRMIPGEPLALRVEQTLTQDALGMIAYLAFESFGLDAVRTELSVSYLDHNLLYADLAYPAYVEPEPEPATPTPTPTPAGGGG